MSKVALPSRIAPFTTHVSFENLVEMMLGGSDSGLTCP
jgi:hypothetical protein